MGYCIKTVDVNFTIPAESVAAARNAWIELNKKGSTGRNRPYFAWMDNWNDQCSTRETLELLRFEVDELEDGSLNIISFDGKSGDEEIFIAAIAHLVAEGSYLVFNGEDGDTYRYVIHNGKNVYQESILAWPELDPAKETTTEPETEDGSTEVIF